MASFLLEWIVVTEEHFPKCSYIYIQNSVFVQLPAFNLRALSKYNLKYPSTYYDASVHTKLLDKHKIN